MFKRALTLAALLILCSWRQMLFKLFDSRSALLSVVGLKVGRRADP
jgi:hypothetical protein